MLTPTIRDVLTSPSLEYADDYGVLECPHCGSDNLHQTRVVVGRRQGGEFDGEDGAGDFVAVDARHTSPTEAVVDVTGVPDAAFLGRRQQLVIEFECEGCEKGPHLAIWQHKGSTFIAWLKMFTARPPDEEDASEAGADVGESAGEDEP